MRVVLVMIFSYILLFSTELKWSHDLNSTLKLANKNGKTILMMFSAPWCPECGYMKEVIFKDEKVKKALEKYNLVEIDITKKDLVPKGYKYIGVPTFFFLDKNGTIISQKDGGAREKEFIKMLQKVAK
jgi:thioredoxin-related protein